MIPLDFREALQGYDKTKIVAFYVLSMSEERLHNMYIEKNKGEIR